MRTVKIGFLSTVLFIASLHSMELFQFPEIENSLNPIDWAKQTESDQNQELQEQLIQISDFLEMTSESDSNETIYSQEINSKNSDNSPTPSKKQKCEICKKLISNLPKHMYTHQKAKPYKCSEGDYESIQKFNCRRHILGKHPPALKAFIIKILKDNTSLSYPPVIYPDPNQCSLCGKQFYNNDSYIYHQKYCHTNIDK